MSDRLSNIYRTAAKTVADGDHGWSWDSHNVLDAIDMAAPRDRIYADDLPARIYAYLMHPYNLPPGEFDKDACVLSLLFAAEFVGSSLEACE